MQVKKASTDQTVYVHLRASADGTSKTALVYNSAGAIASYVRTRGLRTAITLATLAAADSAHADGGFKEVDGTNAKGLYRLDVPDAAFATGVDEVIIHIGFTGVFEESLAVELVDERPGNLKDDAITAAKIAADAIGASEFAQAAADKVWATAARALTDKAGFSISGTKQTLDALNDIAAASVWAVGTRALTDKADFALSIAGILSIWHQLTANIVTADTIGKLLKDNVNAPVGSIPTTPTLQATWTDAKAAFLDIAISSRSSHAAAAIWTAASRALSTPADYKADVSALALEASLTDIKGTGFVKDTHSLPQCLTATGFSTHTAASVWTAASRELSTPNNYKADISALALEATLTAMKGATFAGATDSLEAIRDRGDAAWLTATGFATLNPPSQVLADYKADVSALALEATLTAMKGTGFLTGTDSLEAIRDRGDAAWLTGGAGSLTAAEIADAVLDEQLSDHIDSGSMGEKVYGIRARVPLSPWTKMDLDKHFKLLNDIVKSLDTLPKVKKLDQLTDNVQSLSATLHADVSKAHLILDKQLKSDEKLIGSHTQSIRNIQKLQKDVDEFTHKLSQLASSYDEAIQQSSAKLSALFASSFSESDEKHSRKIVELQNKLDNLDKFDLKPIIKQISTISDSLHSFSQNEVAKGEEVKKLLQQLSNVLKEIEDTPFEKFSKYLKAMFIANLPTETVRQLLSEELAPIVEVLLADMETEADDKPNGEEEHG